MTCLSVLNETSRWCCCFFAVFQHFDTNDTLLKFHETKLERIFFSPGSGVLGKLSQPVVELQQNLGEMAACKKGVYGQTREEPVCYRSHCCKKFKLGMETPLSALKS